MIDMISLNHHWHGVAADRQPDQPIESFSIPDVTAFDPRRIDGKMVWLERDFDLPLQDICIGYTLRVEALPVGTHLSLNGRDFGEVETPFAFDVTDLVALEDNRLRLRVMRGAAGSFGAVTLAAAPCE